MESKDLFERFGGLVKEEPLACIEDNILVPNTCVLESVEPFSGYYSEVMSEHKPQYLYLMIDGSYSFEAITRATLKVRDRFKHPIDVVTGSISMFNQTNQMLRVRNLDQYNHISIIQELYQEQGIQFKKKTKKFEKEKGLIGLQKFFYLGTLDEGLFVDKSQPHHGYFLIPQYIEWEDFKAITKEVKYETDLLFFDAATAYFFQDHGIFDMVRIYRENLTVDKLKAIRDRYLKLIKRA